MNKKYLIFVTIFLASLFFVLSISPASAFVPLSGTLTDKSADELASGCSNNEAGFSFSKFLNPLASLAEKVAKDFGYQVALAAPVSCSANSCIATCDVVCSGSTPTVSIDWEAAAGFSYYILTVTGIGNFNTGSANSYNSYTASSGLANNTTYDWLVEAYNSGNQSSASLGYTDQPHGSFTTLNCSPPTADIKANSSDGPITIPYNTAATISWSSTNVGSCSVAPAGWTGTSNPGISTGNLTSNQTYSLSCDEAKHIIVPPEAGTGGVANLSCNSPGGINVTSAVYAANCGAPTNVNSVAAQCNGLQNCTYTMNYLVDPGFDPAYGCAKDLRINYTCSISDSVTVNVSAVPKPHIVLSPTSFTFSGVSGSATPAVQTLTISNTGNAILNWTVSGVPGKPATWCHLSSNSDNIAVGGNKTYNVSVDAPSNVGSFSDCGIRISDSNADNSPQDASVVYNVSATTIPKGWHDASDCNVSTGWACDADNYNQALDIHFYANGPAGNGVFIGSVSANQPREAAVGAECGGNSNHGFSFNTPSSLKDGLSHSIYAYALNIGSGDSNPLLNGSPKTITCAPLPPGVYDCERCSTLYNYTYATFNSASSDCSNPYNVQYYCNNVYNTTCGIAAGNTIYDSCGPAPCSNGANNPPTCNICTAPLVWNGSNCVTASSCSCSSWTNQSCGTGCYSADQMYQTRTCSPAGCDITAQCYPHHPSCAAAPPPPSGDCYDYLWVYDYSGPSCGARTCGDVYCNSGSVGYSCCVGGTFWGGIGTCTAIPAACPPPPPPPPPPSNRAPTAVNLSSTPPDYCVSGPAATFSWTFSDPDSGDTQSAYQVQADNNSDFSSPEVDSGKVNSSSNSYTTVTGKLSYNSTYAWRVKVWDSSNAESAESAWASGSSFSTPQHAYPSIDFSWTPQNPNANETTQFSDQSTVYGGATKFVWAWTIPDANYIGGTNSSSQNPQVKFTSTGAKQVILRVTDSDGYVCQASQQTVKSQQTVNVQTPLPGWQEVPPQ